MAKSVRSWATGLLGFALVALASCSGAEGDAVEPSASLSQAAIVGDGTIAVNTTSSGKIEFYEQAADTRLTRTHRQYGSACSPNSEVISPVTGSGPAVTGGDSPVVFVRGTENALWYRPEGRTDFVRVGVGGIFKSTPAATKTAEGRIYVFVRGTDDAVWYRWRTSSAIFGGVWGPWIRVPGKTTNAAPAVVSNAQGVHVFAIGQDGTLAWNTLNSSGFVGWRTVGSIGEGNSFISVSAVAWPDSNRIDVAAVRQSGEVKLNGNFNGDWGQWYALGSYVNARAVALAVVRPKPSFGYYADELHAYIRAADGILYNQWFVNGVGWTTAYRNCAEPAPPPVRDFAIQEMRSTSASFKWTRNAPVNHYQIQQVVPSYVKGELIPGVLNDRDFFGLNRDTAYCFNLLSCAYGGCSASATVCDRTKP